MRPNLFIVVRANLKYIKWKNTVKPSTALSVNGLIRFTEILIYRSKRTTTLAS